MLLETLWTLLTENRIHHIAASQGDRILQAAKADQSYQREVTTPVDVVQQLADATDVKYIQWVVNQYIGRQFQFKTVSQVKALLAQFDKARPVLLQKDINGYKTIASLSQALETTRSSTPETAHLAAKVNTVNQLTPSHAELVYNAGGIVIARLITFEGSQRLGAGTKWCTASDEDMFDDYVYGDDEAYNEDDGEEGISGGDLYVIFTPDRKKYQLFIPEHNRNIEFRNAQDASLLNSSIAHTSPIWKYPELQVALHKLIGNRLLRKIIRASKYSGSLEGVDIQHTNMTSQQMQRVIGMMDNVDLDDTYENLVNFIKSANMHNLTMLINQLGQHKANHSTTACHVLNTDFTLTDIRPWYERWPDDTKKNWRILIKARIRAAITDQMVHDMEYYDTFGVKLSPATREEILAIGEEVGTIEQWHMEH